MTPSTSTGSNTSTSTGSTSTPHGHDELEDHDLGLAHDLPILLARRRAMGRRGLLGLLGGVGAAAALTACGAEETASSSASSAATSGAATVPGGPPAGGMGAAATAVAAGEIPEETAGPYPGDGSNGPDALAESGVVRSDLTRSFGDADGVAEGVPIRIRLRVYDLDGEDATPYEGAAVYLWHCDRDGQYSMYTGSAQAENYLRGVQVADADGRLEFTSVFPACYDGRWPHMHFEVYPSVADATDATNRLRTSQLALPQDVCETVYGTAEGYEASVANLQRVSLDTDLVFADGHSLQLATVTGSVDDGYVVSLAVPV
ncbi:3,4-dioxygenase subunit beta [Nocardioides sp. TRM66260-LWL]|uniref:dioxygenase family protein n=1 Tax=Nocardioides sp. TRM66260-LWL TaxID=2874478 RepID=UPI001CC487AD|nr:3,4-dioxygenase subunit beta [Nocardioides sp. TRM66260-LWL]MBZ5735867.1 3,4-dioxygenase subunit beta [Nocardioides sp. TRM66260-LWL]